MKELIIGLIVTGWFGGLIVYAITENKIISLNTIALFVFVAFLLYLFDYVTNNIN